jgi:hypothetical protein
MNSKKSKADESVDINGSFSCGGGTGYGTAPLYRMMLNDILNGNVPAKLLRKEDSQEVKDES